MNRDEQDRLGKPQKDSQKNINSYLLEKLSYSDLCRLLREDETIRSIIREIAHTLVSRGTAEPSSKIMALVTETAASERIESPQSLIATLNPSANPLRQQLSGELELLHKIRADAELSALWLGDSNENEGRQLARIIATAAQWEELLQLWDRLAARCKARQAAITEDERSILQSSLNIHNLRWHDRQARLESVTDAAEFDYRRHERATPRGETIAQEWLPGLINAAGELQKKPLVQTR